MCAICLRRLKRWLDLFAIPACDFRLPGRNAPLDPPDQPVEADGHQHQDDDRDEHGRCIEIVGGIDNDGAEAGNRREEFRNETRVMVGRFSGVESALTARYLPSGDHENNGSMPMCSLNTLSSE